jgi:organic radical activating enzyme
MKIKVSEIFYSLQGEGRFVGVPSVFLRTFGCNFTCSGFGCAPGKTSKEADKIAKNISQYKTLADVPLSKTGCDSFISWHPAFKDLSPNYETEELVTSMKSTIPNNAWIQPNGNEVHLVITGGEPLLGWQRAYTQMLEQPGMSDLNNITFETNGTQKLTPAFANYLSKWVNTVSTPGYSRDITFSVSPKLSSSGEEWNSAIIPSVVAQYQEHGFTYLKFVVENEQHV